MSKGYSTTKVFVAACAGMAFFGVAMLSLGPILGQLGEGAASLPSTLSLGIILGTILFGPIVDRFGYKWLTIISSILALVGLQGLANGSFLLGGADARMVADAAEGLASGIAATENLATGVVEGSGALSVMAINRISIFALGLGGGILNGLTNAVVSDIYDDDHRGGKLGVLGGFYCIGALLWTLLNYFIADYLIPLNSMSAVMFLFIIYFFFISFPASKRVVKESCAAEGSDSVCNSVCEPAGQGNSQAGNQCGAQSESCSMFSQIISLLKYPALLLFAFVLFFQSGYEGSSGSFSITFLTNNGVDLGAATLAMTWFTIGMMAGRFPLGYITSKLKYVGTLYTYLSVALVGTILFFAAPTSMTAVYCGMVLIGFGVGATFPVILNFVGGAFKNNSGTAFSIAIFIALCGQFTFNYIVGKSFEASAAVSEASSGVASACSSSCCSSAFTSSVVFPAMLIGAIVFIMVLFPIALSFARKMK